MRRSVGAGLAAVLLVAVAAGGAWYWRTHLMPGAAPAGGALPAGKPGGFAIPVEAVKVTIGKVVESVPADGTMRSNESVIIAPAVAGPINELDVKEGEKVSACTVLATLEQTLFPAHID